MKSLTRDVLLLGSAATTFLLLAFASPVGAGDGAASASAERALPVQVTQVAPKPPYRDAKPAAPAQDQPEERVEKACGRIERIGKFTLTQCE